MELNKLIVRQKNRIIKEYYQTNKTPIKDRSKEERVLIEATIVAKLTKYNNKSKFLKDVNLAEQIIQIGRLETITDEEFFFEDIIKGI